MGTKLTVDALLGELQSRHPMLIDLSLDRIRRLLDKLGNPHLSLPPVIHIAGTNGKGSTLALLLAMLQAAGHRVHAYTSPHLIRFNERIQLAGDANRTAPIHDDHLADVLARVDATNDGEPMTFFEITTAAAFLAFAEVPADYTLLEVGLGGRLDATNVIDKPRLNIITPVSIDHADKLGDTIGQIAFEKAGILKPATTAVIAAQSEDALASIHQTAERVGTRLVQHGVDYDSFEERGRLIFQNEERLLDLPLPNLVGQNQITNAGTAIAAYLELKGNAPAANATEEGPIEAGLSQADWPARFSRLAGTELNTWVSDDMELWLDGGHNPAAGVVLARTLADLDERAAKDTYLIVGMMNQKDIKGFLEPFAGLIRAMRTIAIPDEQNSATPEELADVANGLSIPATTSTDLRAALAELNELKSGAKRVLICGSLYLAGHVLELAGSKLFEPGQK
ncbi:MAG: folylpolyglutamate synthase/dihydrofolate synthase family protein [Pseudomonadota bacterium]